MMGPSTHRQRRRQPVALTNRHLILVWCPQSPLPNLEAAKEYSVSTSVLKPGHGNVTASTLQEQLELEPVCPYREHSL